MSAEAILLSETDSTSILAYAFKCVAAEALADLAEAEQAEAEQAEATEMAHTEKLDEARKNETGVKQVASTGAVIVKAVEKTETMVDDTGYADLRKMQGKLPAKPAFGFKKDEAKTVTVDPVRVKFGVCISSRVGVR